MTPVIWIRVPVGDRRQALRPVTDFGLRLRNAQRQRGLRASLKAEWVCG